MPQESCATQVPGVSFFSFLLPPDPLNLKTVSNLNRDSWMGWRIEGMISDLEFERDAFLWAREMLERFPQSPNRHQYYHLMKDAERRIKELS